MAETTPLTYRPTVQGIRFLLCIPSVFLAILFPTVGYGQGAQDRYQLGRRLERFEQAWQTAPTALRAKSTDSMEQAVQSFFSLQLSRAGKMLDQAWLTVSGVEDDEAPERLQNIRWKIDFETSLLDLQTPILKGRIGVFYDPEHETHSRSQIVLDVWPWDESPDRVMLSDSIQSPLMSKTLNVSADESFEVDLSGLASGDYVVTAHLEGSPRGKFDWICPSVCLVDQLHQRLEKWERWTEANPKEVNNQTANSTAKFLAREIARGKKGTAFEIDLPWNKLLSDLEQIIEPTANGPKDASFDRWISKPGWKWMQLSRGRSNQVVRIEVPEYNQKNANEKLPVLIALHGAGGSENMFFQTYGAGRLVELAKKRGWIVVSPRQTLTGLSLDVPQMIDALAEHLPVDPTRVLLVGHSMGAAQALSQVSKSPEQVRMVAALGGGGNVRDTEAIRKVPFYVAAGDRDFGKPRAKALSQQLKRIGSPVVYREYSDVEHMVIVQAALDDVFAFFDEGMK